ncbi:MAG: hypothetical protein V4549_07455 [Bacteroidota bacterium]
MATQLTLNNPPEGMNAIQTFENKEHLDSWIEENKIKLGSIIIDSESLICSDGEFTDVIEIND